MFAVGEDHVEEVICFGAFGEEGLLVRRFGVCVAGRDHHAFDADVHHFVEELANSVWVGTFEECGVGGDSEAAFDGEADARDCFVVCSFSADGEVVVFALAVHVDGEGEVLGGLEHALLEFLFEQDGVGAHVDVLLAFDESLDELFDVGVEEGFAAGDRDHGCAAFVDGTECVFDGHVSFEDVGGVLDFAAACA